MTTSELKTLLREGMEDTTMAQRVRAWATQREGQAIAKNRIPEGFWVRREHGMTHLETPNYTSSRGARGYSFLVAYKETGALVPSPEKLERLNTCYFSGANKRNALRADLLNDPVEQRQIAMLFTSARNHFLAFQKAKKELKAALGKWSETHEMWKLFDECQKEED